MHFIGVISNSKRFDILRKMINNKNKNEYTLININNKSIENYKNIKFEIIILLELPKQFSENKNKFEKICNDAKIFLINSDIQFEEDFLKEIRANIITFGGNHLSTVTFSSVTDESILISVQRSFSNLKGKIIDVGEYSIFIKKIYRNFLNEVLASFIIYV